MRRPLETCTKIRNLYGVVFVGDEAVILAHIGAAKLFWQ